MELIPQQVEMLKNELSSLSQKRQELIDSKSNRYAICNENQTGDNDREIIDSVAAINAKINKICTLLDNAIVIEDVDDSHINIGTEFDMILTTPRGSVQEETRTLIAEKVTLEDMSQYISLQTNIGKAVYGRQVGEDFSYILPSGKTMFGTIVGLRKLTEYDNGETKGNHK